MEFSFDGDNAVIDGVTYTKKETNDGKSFVIIRSRDAGVHAGYVDSICDNTVTLSGSRRLWHWKGALTLSELSQHGTTEPDSCKFGCVVPSIMIASWCECIECTESASDSILGVKVWTK